MTQTITSSTAAWLTFEGSVSAVTAVGHSLVRVTCRGEELRHFADNGWDQRIKLVLPLPDSGFAHFPRGEEWYATWREQQVEEQNPIRTYTVRAVRPELGEVDIDMVLHGDGGPASAWAQSVTVGDPVALLGPNARFEGEHGGVEFTLPARGVPILLAGDETAQPAIATILEQLPEHTTGRAILEMPHPDDRIELTRPAGVEIEWLIRGDRAVGEPTLECFRRHATELFAVSSTAVRSPETDDTDDEPLWEVPEAPATGQYAWIAGEAATVRAMRRLLVNEIGVDKASVAFMGYWRI